MKARLNRVMEPPVGSMARWRIELSGASNSTEIEQINRWAQAANILPHIEAHAE